LLLLTHTHTQWANEEGEEAHGYDVSEGTYYDTVADPPTFSSDGDLVGREEISEFEGTYYNHNQHPNSDMENDDMEEGGGRSRRLSFFTYKSSCMEDSMREATWSDGEACGSRLHCDASTVAYDAGGAMEKNDERLPDASW
uniref:Cadherin_C domain-containing protein n=1 Tax=Taenia asiatica TaxID=60517 RepID=A0A0R3WHE8_TAEAS